MWHAVCVCVSITIMVHICMSLRELVGQLQGWSLPAGLHTQVGSYLPAYTPQRLRKRTPAQPHAGAPIQSEVTSDQTALPMYTQSRGRVLHQMLTGAGVWYTRNAALRVSQ